MREKHCKLHLLGPLRIEGDAGDARPRFRSQRTQALLGYLVAAARPVTRELLGTLFWPDKSASKARASLRRELHNLGRILPDCWESSQTTIAFCPRPGLRVDLYEVQQLAGAERWEPALAWLQGEFLEGVAAPDNLEVESWLQGERERWRIHAEQILLNAAQALWLGGDPAGARRALARLLRFSPWHEEAHRQLMRLLAQQGRADAAIRQYRQCQALLEKELGVPPSPQTQALYERIVTERSRTEGEKGRQKEAPTIPLIGRQTEWKRLQAVAASLQPGDSRCIWISGEAGIGKTRLAEELLAWGHLHGYQVARTRAYGAHGDLAYAPLAHLLRTPELRERITSLNDVWLAEIARIMPELHVARPDLPVSGPLSQGGRRVRFFEALCHALLEERPLLLLVDDLQWCDEETLGWLHYLLCRQHERRLLVVGTYRNQEVAPDHPLWQINESLHREEQLLEMELRSLPAESATRLAEQVTEKPLSPAEGYALYNNTRGNPLFVVEIMRARRPGAAAAEPDPAGSNQGQAQAATAVALPPRIFSLMHYRLRRLSPVAQRVVHLAALSGRAVEKRLLLAAGRDRAPALTTSLAELCDRGVLREAEAGVFDFTHDKLRDVALTQVRPARRRRLSFRIAQAYEALYAGQVEEIVGELAVAYEGAGQIPEAVTYYRQAAEAEMQRGSYQRAAAALEQALALIAGAGQQDLAETELVLQLTLGNVARAVQRNSVPKARAAFARAAALGEALDAQRDRLQALFGLAQYHLTEADVSGAAAYGRQCIEVARQLDDQVGLARARLMVGFVDMVRGKFAQGRATLEPVRAAYQESGLREALAGLPGQDTGVMANIYLSVALWFLGYPDQSDERMADAQALAGELSAPINVAYVRFYQVLLGLYRHELDRAGHFAERLVGMAEAYEIGFLLAGGHAFQAYVTAARAPGDRRLLEAFGQRMAIYHDQVSGLSRPFYLSLVARLWLAAEAYEEAEEALRRALAWMEQVEDLYSVAEIYRIQGELWTMTGAGNPEIAYLKALTLAKAQQARSHQLRTAVSLGRFWQGQGEQAEAYRLLSACYGWFAEGFGARDLREAGALLGELAGEQAAAHP